MSREYSGSSFLQRLARGWECVGSHYDGLRRQDAGMPQENPGIALEPLLAATSAIMKWSAASSCEVRLKYFVLRAVTTSRELPFARKVLADGRCKWGETLKEEAARLGITIGEFWLEGQEGECHLDGERDPDLWQPLKPLGIVKCPAGEGGASVRS